MSLQKHTTFKKKSLYEFPDLATVEPVLNVRGHVGKFVSPVPEVAPVDGEERLEEVEGAGVAGHDLAREGTTRPEVKNKQI